jgi:hypothetical protein
MKKKEIIILRLYLNFMENKQALNDMPDDEFLQEVAMVSRTESMDPEDAFVISKENRQNLKDLLVRLQK